jgi:hypothetical protein
MAVGQPLPPWSPASWRKVFNLQVIVPNWRPSGSKAVCSRCSTQVAISPVVLRLTVFGCFVKESVEKDLQEDLDSIAFPHFVRGSSVRKLRAKLFFSFYKKKSCIFLYF